MTEMLEEALDAVRALPEDDQDRAAHALLAFARERHDYSFTADQVDGIHHAMQQADRGEFASDAAMREIFGRAL